MFELGAKENKFTREERNVSNGGEGRAGEKVIV